MARIERLAEEIAQVDPVHRLPLFQISFPALRRHTPAELRAFTASLQELAWADGRINMFEYALTRLLRLQIYEIIAPRAWRAPTVAPKLYALRGEVQVLMSILAQAGNADVGQARAAYDQGMRQLLPVQTPEYMPASNWQALDQALVRLDFLPAMMKQELIKALVSIVFHNRQVTVAEAELLRVVCASLHCPMPPLTQANAA